MVTVTVDVRDFSPEGDAPPGVSLEVARAVPSFADGLIVSGGIGGSQGVIKVPLIAGEGEWEAEGNTYYRCLLRGVRGLGNAVYVLVPDAGTISLATLYSSFAVDPTTLEPSLNNFAAWEAIQGVATSAATNAAAAAADAQALLDQVLATIGSGFGGIGIDDDGVPFYAVVEGGSIAEDTDGVPYYV